MCYRQFAGRVYRTSVRDGFPLLVYVVVNKELCITLCKVHWRIRTFPNSVFDLNVHYPCLFNSGNLVPVLLVAL